MQLGGAQPDDLVSRLTSLQEYLTKPVSRKRDQELFRSIFSRSEMVEEIFTTTISISNSPLPPASLLITHPPSSSLLPQSTKLFTQRYPYQATTRNFRQSRNTKAKGPHRWRFFKLHSNPVLFNCVISIHFYTTGKEQQSKSSR